MEMEFIQPTNYLTVNFSQTYPQPNRYFRKINLLLKLS